MNLPGSIKYDREEALLICSLRDKQIFVLLHNQAFAELMQNKTERKVSRRGFDSGRLCKYNLSELVRIDFVFPYERIAATRVGLVPEPFERDADFATTPEDMEELKARLAGIFK